MSTSTPCMFGLMLQFWDEQWEYSGQDKPTKYIAPKKKQILKKWAFQQWLLRPRHCHGVLATWILQVVCSKEGLPRGGPPPPRGVAPVFIEKCLNAWTSKAVAHSNWRQKRRGNDARMPFSLIYFFAPVSIFYILHNYVIPQTMPHAIPQTHSAIYPHRENLELYHMLNIAFENE